MDTGRLSAPQRSIVYRDKDGNELGRIIFGDSGLTFTAGSWVAQTRYHSTELRAISLEHEKQMAKAVS
jgi:hypothetical protein